MPSEQVRVFTIRGEQQVPFDKLRAGSPLRVRPTRNRSESGKSGRSGPDDNDVLAAVRRG